MSGTPDDEAIHASSSSAAAPTAAADTNMSTSADANGDSPSSMAAAAGVTTGWGDWSSTFSTFDVSALTTTLSAKASEAYNELNAIDVRALADTIAERANEAAKELEARADEAFGVQKNNPSGSSGGVASSPASTSTNAPIANKEVVEHSEPTIVAPVEQMVEAKAPSSAPSPKTVSKPRAKTSPAKPAKLVAVEADDESADEDVAPDVDGMRLKAVLRELKVVKKQLVAREDEIARRAEQRASLDAEQDAESERAALAEQKLADAEIRLRSLTQEFKELKKIADSHVSADMLVKEKDEIIKEVMAEGEVLSKKQAEMEGTIKKLRKELRERDEVQIAIDGEVRDKGASIEKLSAELKATREELASEKARLSAELNEQKDYYLSKLAQAKEELTDAEVKANATRSEELANEVKALREREQGLKDQVADLQHSLQRSSAALERQEERFKNDLAAVEERAQTAETSHDELLRRMPESTRPLLRQIEALQMQATENADAWAAAERASSARLTEVQERADTALAREEAALDEKEAALREKRAMLDQVDKLKGEIEALKRQLEAQQEKTAAETKKLAKYTESFAEQEGRMSALENEANERESKLKQLLAQERGKHKQLGEAWDRERADLLANVAQLEGTLKASQDELNVLKSERFDMNTPLSPVKSAQTTTLLTGGEAGLSLAVRDTLAQLKSQLAARTTELEIAQEQIKKLEQTRESLANELVNSAKLADSGVADTVALDTLRARLEALERRYDAALEVIGERDEECEEMRDRLSAMRSMLDTQATQIAQLSKTRTIE